MDENQLKTERIQVLMTPRELEALDNWAFANRIRSRGEAVRRLIDDGLGKAQPGALSSRSGPGGARKPRSTGKSAPSRAHKPGPKAQALPMSKEAQIRALREQDAG